MSNSVHLERRSNPIISVTKPGIYTHNLVVCFYEFLGTAMLVLGYNFTAAGLAVGFDDFALVIFNAATTPTPGFFLFGLASEGQVSHGVGIPNMSLSVSDVPEPMSLALLGVGLAGIAAARRRKGGTAATIA